MLAGRCTGTSPDVPQQPDRLAVAIPGLYPNLNTLYRWRGWPLTQEATCWAHERRKLHDLHAARPSAITTEALRRIAELYVMEAQIRCKPPHERQQVREQRSRPLLDDFGSWLRATLESCRASRTPRPQFSMRSIFGRRCCATPTTASSRSTTRPQSTR